MTDPKMYFSQPPEPSPGDLWITPESYMVRVWNGQEWVLSDHVPAQREGADEEVHPDG